MGRKKKKNNDLKKTGIISLVVIGGVLGYINLINSDFEVPDITSTPFYQKIFGAKNESRVQENIITENLTEPMQIVKKDVKIFFLARSANKDVYMPVFRKNDSNTSDIEYAVRCLLSGPTTEEQSKGAYSEIPPTKLISVKETPDKIYLNITSSFEAGGGADSIYKRMYQLIKTVNYNTSKPVYLLFDGKLAEALGGEGLIIKQPLNGSSLDE